MNKRSGDSISETQRLEAERQIREKQREVKYDLRDFTVDYIVQQFQKDLFFIPEYQRKYIWTSENRSRFIESVVLGLPIPMMFVADMDDGRLEIVDGAQRIQTLESFLNGDLLLDRLERLDCLNGFRFADLPEAQARKFSTRALRLVVLEDVTTPEIRQEIFSRVNTSGMKARASEIRRGAHVGEFMKFIAACTKDPLFKELCPLSPKMISRREDEELILRFFAYSDRYKSFRHDVDKFLDKFVRDHQHDFEKDRLRREYKEMLRFVKKNFRFGFAKSMKAKTTPRVRFEAIAVGVNLALRMRPELAPTDMSWLDSEEFVSHTRTHASNSGPRLTGRIEYVRDQLLLVDAE